jgi:hypothetical protein
MQQPPETNEQARAGGNTTPLPYTAKISRLRVLHEGRQGRFVPLVSGLLLVLALAVIVLTSPLGRGLLAHLSPRVSSPVAASPELGVVVGHIFFESSGQYNADGSQGVADELQIDLSGISAPAAGMSYYGWLLADRRAAPGTLALGALPTSGGSIHVHYTAADHRNLILFTGSFLITQEEAGAEAPQPSANEASWRFRADFPQTPAPRASLLDHLRSLLGEDPALGRLGLHGGLAYWFYRNVQKVLESASAAHDYWGQPQAVALLRSHFTLILDYLDGAPYAWEARVGLLEGHEGQNPPGYVYDIGLHLHGIIKAPGATAADSALAGEIDATLLGVTLWLNQLRADVVQLAAMSDAQLLRPQASHLLNDMYSMAQYAFIGQPNLSGNAALGGASLINYDVLRLATLPVDALPVPG